MPDLKSVLASCLLFCDFSLAQQFCQPEQVRLSIRNQSQFVVTWTTFSPSQSQVEYGQNPVDLNMFVNGTSEIFIDGGQEKRKQFIHRVFFPILSPKKRFYYRVGSEDCGWSDIFWLKTFPNVSEHWSPTLAIFGDMGNVNAVSLPRLQRETQEDMYDMILHIGDFAYDMFDENGTRGDEFLRQIEPIAAYVPYMTCPGNHESAYNFSHYKYRFTMPDWNNGQSSNNRPMFYSFDFGPIHFISINTEYYFSLNYGENQVSVQYNWLVDDLKNANNPENRAKRPWIILFGHRPMYCSTKDFTDCANHDTRTRKGLPNTHLYGLEDPLYQYNVDMVLWAHEHDFERFWPIYDFQIKNGSYAKPYTNPKAPVHIITGSAGCQERHDPWLPMPDMTAFRSLDYGYSRMKVYNSTHLKLSQVSDDKGGQIIDHFWLVKEAGHSFHSALMH